MGVAEPHPGEKFDTPCAGIAVFLYAVRLTCRFFDAGRAD
jgi:hypothetical protein